MKATTIFKLIFSHVPAVDTTTLDIKYVVSKQSEVEFADTFLFDAER